MGWCNDKLLSQEEIINSQNVLTVGNFMLGELVAIVMMNEAGQLTELRGYIVNANLLITGAVTVDLAFEITNTGFYAVIPDFSLEGINKIQQVNDVVLTTQTEDNSDDENSNIVSVNFSKKQPT